MQEILSKISIGERLKNLRLDSGLSQKEFAEMLQLSRSNYSQIELGYQYPSYEVLYKIASYYNKSYEWILHGKDAETPLKEDTGAPGDPDADLQTLFGELNGCVRKFESGLLELKREVERLRKIKGKQ